MAVMYTANHMKVRAIVALTESGATPLWMSRIRSDIPVYAFTRHEATRRRVTLYRGRVSGHLRRHRRRTIPPRACTARCSRGCSSCSW